MSDDYALAILKVSLAQICQNVGFQGATNISLSVLLDIYRRYMETMCKTMRRYCDHVGRTQPVLEDIDLTFSELRIPLRELSDYATQVAPVPFKFKVPLFPIPRPSKLKIPHPDAEELRTRPDYIPTYLPLMKPEPEPEVTVTDQQQPMVSEDVDNTMDAEKISSARTSVHRTTVSSLGKQNLSQSGDLIADFSDFDAVKAGLVKFIRIPTPPPPPPPPPRPSSPPAMSPAHFGSIGSSMGVGSAPGITVAEDKRTKKKYPTVLDVRPDMSRSGLSLSSPRTKLKISLPSAYKKKRVMPMIVKKRDQKLKIFSSGEHPIVKEGEGGVAVAPVVKRRGRPPGKVGRPPGKVDRPPGKVGRPPKYRPPVSLIAAPVLDPPKCDISAESVVADVVASVSNLDTSSASSSIDELVTSVIEETRKEIKAHQRATEHFADSVNSVALAPGNSGISESNSADDIKLSIEERTNEEPVSVPVSTPTPIPTSETASTVSTAPDTAKTIVKTATTENTEFLKSILPISRKLFDKEILKQRIKEKNERKEAQEKKIQAVLQKTFPPIAKKEECATAPALTPAPAPTPAPTRTPTPVPASAPKPISDSTSSEPASTAKPPRRPPGIPPSSLHMAKEKSETAAPPIRLHFPKLNQEKLALPKYEQPPLFQPEHITKSATASTAETRKVAPLVISKKGKPPAELPPPAPESKRKEATKLIIKLPHKPPSSAGLTAIKEHRKHGIDKEREREREREQEKVKLRGKHQTATIETEKQKKPKPVQKVEQPTLAPVKKTDTSSPKVPKLKINIGKPKLDSDTPAESVSKMKPIDAEPIKPIKTSSPLHGMAGPSDLGEYNRDRSLSPPPKSPSAFAHSPLHIGSVGDVEVGYESPPPPTPSPGGSCPPSPIYLDVQSEGKSMQELSSPPVKKQRFEPVEMEDHFDQPMSSYRTKPRERSAPSTSQAMEPMNEGTWYCPICNVPYMDGGPDMIGCDMCDRWFHWACVGLSQAPPSEENWYCIQCKLRKHSSTSGQKRKQKTNLIKKRHK